MGQTSGGCSVCSEVKASKQQDEEPKQYLSQDAQSITCCPKCMEPALEGNQMSGVTHCCTRMWTAGRCLSKRKQRNKCVTGLFSGYLWPIRFVFRRGFPALVVTLVQYYLPVCACSLLLLTSSWSLNACVSTVGSSFSQSGRVSAEPPSITVTAQSWSKNCASPLGGTMGQWWASWSSTKRVLLLLCSGVC